MHLGMLIFFAALTACALLNYLINAGSDSGSEKTAAGVAILLAGLTFALAVIA